MMSSTGQSKRTLAGAAKKVYGMGGVRAFYRGLTVGDLDSLLKIIADDRVR